LLHASSFFAVGKPYRPVDAKLIAEDARRLQKAPTPMALPEDIHDERWIQIMRDCGPVSVEHKDLIDQFEETGDVKYWDAFVELVRIASKTEK
jgi:hypothetical protein